MKKLLLILLLIGSVAYAQQNVVTLTTDDTVSSTPTIQLTLPASSSVDLTPKFEDVDGAAACTEGQKTFDTGGATKEQCTCFGTQWYCQPYSLGTVD